MEAANGGMMEVELGKIAQENASSPRVKAFGAMMVKDHTEAGNNLKQIATSLNIALPDSVSNDSRKEIDNMKMKKGKEFDKAYVSMMLDDHKNDIAEFRKCADNCSDSTIKSFACQYASCIDETSGFDSGYCREKTLESLKPKAQSLKT